MTGASTIDGVGPLALMGRGPRQRRNALTPPVIATATLPIAESRGVDGGVNALMAQSSHCRGRQRQQHNNDDNNNCNTRGNKLVTEVRLGDEDRKPSTDVDGLAVVTNDHLLHRGCGRGVVLEDQGAELGQGKDPASDLQCRDACDAVDGRR